LRLTTVVPATMRGICPPARIVRWPSPS
jgi:hypothetical protein